MICWGEIQVLRFQGRDPGFVSGLKINKCVWVVCCMWCVCVVVVWCVWFVYMCVKYVLYVVWVCGMWCVSMAKTSEPEALRA